MPLDADPLLDAVARAIADAECRTDRKIEAAIWAAEDRQRDPMDDWEHRIRGEML